MGEVLLAFWSGASPFFVIAAYALGRVHGYKSKANRMNDNLPIPTGYIIGVWGKPVAVFSPKQKEQSDG